MPSPRSVEAILKAGEMGPGESTVMIPLLADAGRTVRANLTRDAGLLAASDDAASQRGMTRSAFLASAAWERTAERR